jgi:hypothetical protein
MRPLLIMPCAPAARISRYGCIRAEHGELFHSRRRISDEVPLSAAGAVESTVTLFRPVGLAELALIAASGFRAFPPRLPHQPFFYSVLNEANAVQIARDWNTRDAASGYAGYVTRLCVRTAFLQPYPVQTVGTAMHQEYGIPAEAVDAFNEQIVGRIAVIGTYRRPSR